MIRYLPAKMRSALQVDFRVASISSISGNWLSRDTTSRQITAMLKEITTTIPVSTSMILNAIISEQPEPVG